MMAERGLASIKSAMDSKRIVHRVKGKYSRQINSRDFRKQRTSPGRDQQLIVRERFPTLLTINDFDSLCCRIDGDRCVPRQKLDSFELCSVGQLMPVRRFSTQEERQPADAEVRVAVGEDNSYCGTVVELTCPQSSTDSRIAATDD